MISRKHALPVVISTSKAPGARPSFSSEIRIFAEDEEPVRFVAEDEDLIRLVAEDEDLEGVFASLSTFFDEGSGDPSPGSPPPMPAEAASNDRLPPAPDGEVRALEVQPLSPTVQPPPLPTDPHGVITVRPPRVDIPAAACGSSYAELDPRSRRATPKSVDPPASPPPPTSRRTRVTSALPTAAPSPPAARGAGPPPLPSALLALPQHVEPQPHDVHRQDVQPNDVSSILRPPPARTAAPRPPPRAQPARPPSRAARAPLLIGAALVAAVVSAALLARPTAPPPVPIEAAAPAPQAARDPAKTAASPVGAGQTAVATIAAPTAVDPGPAKSHAPPLRGSLESARPASAPGGELIASPMPPPAVTPPPPIAPAPPMEKPPSAPAPTVEKPSIPSTGPVLDG